jgi:hypothetical protein
MRVEVEAFCHRLKSRSPLVSTRTYRTEGLPNLATYHHQVFEMVRCEQTAELPFVPINDIARQSVSSGGRFRLSAPPPGCPVRRFGRLLASPAPVARFGSTSR